MEIRKAIPSDAKGMVDLFYKLDFETKFMMMEPGERIQSVDGQAARIREFSDSADRLMAVTLIDNAIVGFIVATRGTANRNRHSVYMVTGVAKQHWGKGIGQKLVYFMEDWAKAASVHRIEFTVVESNEAARALYKKCGYLEEGIKRESLKIDGIYTNEIYMSKLI